jgi:hypothetical protein
MANLKPLDAMAFINEYLKFDFPLDVKDLMNLLKAKLSA